MTLNYIDDTYSKYDSGSQIRTEFIEELNEALSEFFKFSGLYGHNNDFFMQVFELSQQNKVEFNNNRVISPCIYQFTSNFAL